MRSAERDDSCEVQDFHLAKKFSSSGWSQSTLAFHISWIITLAVRATGAANPRGSYREQTADSTPRFVSGRFKFLMSNPSSSVSANQRIPSALSTGSSSKSRFRSGEALFSVGMVAKTFLLFVMNFVRLKPP